MEVRNLKTQFAKPAVILLLSVGGVGVSLAHDPITTQITWNRDISRIAYHRCASCHHDGGQAFSLMSYQVARPWAKAIKEEVLERRMPPFAAVKGFGEVKDEDALTQEELHIIADWVEGGSPEGDDPKLLPKAPEFSDPKNAQEANASVPSALKKPSPQLVDDGTLTLKQAMTLIGARAGAMSEGASIQAVVQKPDGSIEPLIWIYDYKPKFDRAYYFEKPLLLPAGSKIDLYPAGSGSIALLLNK
jgi:hypothetical protein